MQYSRRGGVLQKFVQVQYNGHVDLPATLTIQASRYLMFLYGTPRREFFFNIFSLYFIESLSFFVRILPALSKLLIDDFPLI